MARLFFALQPDPAARTALAALAAQIARGCGGRAVPAAKIHLTLAFLGDVDPAGMERACATARAVSGDAFRMAIDRVGSFARPEVAWAAPGIVPPELTRLHDVLASRLREAGFALEARSYAPHITIARRIARPVTAAEPMAVAWDAREFVLVESDLATGAYRDLARWTLGGPGERQRTS